MREMRGKGRRGSEGGCGSRCRCRCRGCGSGKGSAAEEAVDRGYTLHRTRPQLHLRSRRRGRRQRSSRCLLLSLPRTVIIFLPPL